MVHPSRLQGKRPRAGCVVGWRVDLGSTGWPKGAPAGGGSVTPIAKLLVANRGEIAVRVIQAAQAQGLKTVAVHSEADAQALHVRLADEAVAIGPAPVVQSYLKQEAILAAARSTGADAVHPGYGLLSENASFARACAEAGLTFVGPPAELIARMGDKAAALAAMREAGVPTLPGSEVLADLEAAQTAAAAIGYPVMLKAVGGGGGIGLQALQAPEELEKAWKLATSRAKAYFGDDRMYLEKALVAPRHVEVQLLADHHGEVVAVFERDCSIQRRHQKVVEEAPAPGLRPEVRAALCEAAVRAAKALGYRNAGTMEFLMDADQRFYFLEMNTRIQVEHPVSEMVSGLDLVGWQLRIAQGEALKVDLSAGPQGHAIEVRVYAEHPKTFMPSPGTIAKLRWPQGPGIRVDTWVEEGTVITPHYDPMIAKLAVWGANRAAAVDALVAALEATEIEGLTTNLPALKAIARHPDFVAGRLDTAFLATRDLALEALA
jgi:acetyl-CoA carboxylase biotin carboxylase subunit